MTLETESESKKLLEWFSNLITYFRGEYEKVPEDEKKWGIDSYANYLSPCQIEVFWLKSPEIQLIFKSNLRNRPDKEIIIHGPYDSHEFLSKIKPVLNEPRWVEARIGDRWHPIDESRSLAFVLAAHLHKMVEGAKMYQFQPNVIEGRGGGILAGEGLWADTYYGNIAKSDYVTLANENIEDTRKRAQESKKNSEAKGAKMEPPRIQNPKGYGVYFFPPILVGEQPQLTPADVLYGRNSSIPVNSFFKDGIKCEFGKHTAVVNDDGFIFLPISDKESALKAFNVIMAVGMLRDLGFLAVREHELSEVEYNKDTMQTGSMAYNPDATLRTRLFNERWGMASTGYRRKELREETLRSIIAEAGKIFDEAKYAEELRLLSESYTHLNDAEYAPSFVMSWSIIERHASRLWKKRVDEKELDEDRTSKLLDTNRWSVDYLLEVLNISCDITEEEYDKFMEMKSKRNRFIHRGKQIAREDAEKCFEIAREIVTKKIN